MGGSASRRVARLAHGFVRDAAGVHDSHIGGVRRIGVAAPRDMLVRPNHHDIAFVEIARHRTWHIDRAHRHVAPGKRGEQGVGLRRLWSEPQHGKSRAEAIEQRVADTAALAGPNMRRAAAGDAARTVIEQVVGGRRGRVLPGVVNGPPGCGRLTAGLLPDRRGCDE